MPYLITRESCRKARACYSDKELAGLIPERGCTPAEVAEATGVLAEDRYWALVYASGASECILREHACWCARRALQSVNDPDPRSVAAVEVAERYVRGEATAEELSDAWSAACNAAHSAACNAAHSAVHSAAYSVADSAAESAAYSVAESAAYNTAQSAAESAAQSAVWAACSAAWSVVHSAVLNAAYNAAYNAERIEQVKDLARRLTAQEPEYAVICREYRND
jgi:hypothetical protein